MSGVSKLGGAGLSLGDRRSAASTAALPFSVTSLVLLLGWFNLYLYLVRRVEDSPLVPNQYRSLCR